MPANAIHARNTADWTIDHSLLVQSLDPGEPYAARCPFYVVDHPDGVALFDTGVSHEMARDPASYGPYGAPEMSEMARGIDRSAGRPATDHLDDLGYTPADVDYVVCSHLHVDHAGALTEFPEAEFLVHPEELRYAFHPDPAQRPFYLAGDFAPLRSDRYDVTPTPDGYDVFGDGAVEVVPTPGHTPGHQSLRVELPDAGTVVLAADAANLRAGYDHGLVASFSWSLEASTRSLQRLERIEREADAAVYLGHEREDLAAFPADGLR